MRVSQLCFVEAESAGELRELSALVSIQVDVATARSTSSR